MRISQNRAGTLSYYGYDAGGSTRELINSNGAVTDTYAYDAFGNTVARTGSTVNEFQYRGEQFDGGLEMYYLRARYYRPRAGRFLTADRFEDETIGACDCGGQANTPLTLKLNHLYAYAGTDPLNRLDPSGRDDVQEVVATDEAGVLEGNEQEVQYNKILEEAKARYPKKATKFECHHVIPTYLGGPPSGPMVRLNAAYHQLITNAFKNAWAYGQGPPIADQSFIQIMLDVYADFPLPWTPC